MSSNPVSSNPESRARPRRIALIVAGVTLLVLVLCASWVAVRAFLAQDTLQLALPVASRAQEQIRDGDGDAAEASISEFADRARTAADLTSDPIYRASEIVPGVGPNLTAFREMAAVIDSVASQGLSPLAAVANNLTADALKPVDGAVQLQPLVDAAPALKAADTVLNKARADIADIDTSDTIDQISDAVVQLSAVVDDATSAIDTVSTTAQLMPAMLGLTENREYLLMFQNNAEVRARGGLPGALALVSTSGGRFELTLQTDANAFPYYDDHVLPLDRATLSLYDGVGRYMQNVNATPDFPTAATLASEMWFREYGVRLDGVIALDPIMLSYFLEASGPVTLSTGDVIDSGNAVDFLLSQVYEKYPVTSVQDLVFAEAASSVFAALSAGDLDADELISALVRGSEERRILIWNERPAEQELLTATTFAGTLPATNERGDVMGVFLNDATGGKMDYYLDARVTAGRCDSAGAATHRADVSLTSSAPADGAESLPAYVTANGAYGVEPGNIRTRVLVYGPVGSTILVTKENGENAQVQVEEHLDRAVAQFVVEVEPGETSTLSVELAGTDDATTGLSLQMTPLVRESPVEIKSLPCG